MASDEMCEHCAVELFGAEFPDAEDEVQSEEAGRVFVPGPLERVEVEQ